MSASEDTVLHHQERLPEVPLWAEPKVPPSPNPSSDGPERSSNFRFLATRAATATRNLVDRLKSKTNRPTRVKVIKDADELKKQLHRAINEGKKAYNVEDLYWKTGVMQKIARSSLFQNATLAMILGYALWLSYDTDANQASTLLAAEMQFQVMEHVFCAYFLVELTIRFFAFREKCQALCDGWFVFDLLLVLLGVAEAWVMTIVLLLSDSQGTFFSNSSSLRLIRLLRLSRVARIARLLRAAPELMIMVKGMIAAARSMLTTGVLVVAVLYVFGIAMRQATEGSQGGRLYFNTVWTSMLSLLLYATLLDSPSVVMGSLNWFGGALFLVVIALSAWLLLNMLIGVMCEVVSGVSQTERQAIAEAFVREKVQQIIQDRHGVRQIPSISRRVLIDMLHDRNATTLLNEAGVDVVGLVDVADYIFQSDHSEEVEKELTFEEFLNVIMSLRGSNAVTLKDIMDLRRTLHRNQTELRSVISELEERTPLASPLRPLPNRTLGGPAAETFSTIRPGNTLDGISTSLGTISLSRDTTPDGTSSRIFLPSSIAEEVHVPDPPAWQQKIRSILEHHEVIEARQALARKELQELLEMLPEALRAHGWGA
ncbi:unnamed protein product [Durusdinium trenchii]|uniref:Uncharacterized protein n=2 Tax=Durusdinium trenchii TaxID=1381693 RepID=A0ABP0R809_9DINO